MGYAESLEAIKERYPFDEWWQDTSIEELTADNCARVASIMDALVLNLIAPGPAADEEGKVEQIKAAVLALNALNESVGGGLLSTDEREDLCPLFDAIAEAAGIDTTKYEGNDITFEWREW